MMNPNHTISNFFYSSEKRSVITEYLVDLNSFYSLITEKQWFAEY